MAELSFFSLDFGGFFVVVFGVFLAYEMFWINMQLKWLVTDWVHF